MLPLKLYETELVAEMSESELKRYLTLLRLANYGYGSQEVKLRREELAKLDGVSTRAARDATAKLKERGLIDTKRTRPETIVLVGPENWPRSMVALRLGRTDQGLTIKREDRPVHWEELSRRKKR